MTQFDTAARTEFYEKSFEPHQAAALAQAAATDYHEGMDRTVTPEMLRSELEKTEARIGKLVAEKMLDVQKQGMRNMLALASVTGFLIVGIKIFG